MEASETANGPSLTAEATGALAILAGTLSAAINELPQRLVMKDTHSVIVACNTAFADFLGMKAADIVGKSDLDLMPRDLAERSRAVDRRVIADKHETTFEGPYRRDEEQRWLRTTTKPLVNDDGSVIGLLVVFDDITEQHQATEALRRRAWALAALNRAEHAMVHAETEQELLRQVCEAVTLDDEYLLCWIGWAEQDTGRSVTVAAIAGAAHGFAEGLHVDWGDGPLALGPTGASIREARTVTSNHAMTSAAFTPWRERAREFGIAASLSVPLKGPDRVLGVLVVYARDEDAFGPEEAGLFEEFAETLLFGVQSRRTRIAYDDAVRARLEQEASLSQSLEDSLGAMAGVLEQRDPYTAGHQQHVASLAVAIGRELALDEPRLHALRLAALVHDLGKIEIPVEILSKPARLTKEEFALMKRHPEVGYDLLHRVRFPWPIADIIRQHHEYLDGSGYPHGLTEGQIMLEAKILTVADIVESVSSDRPYRPSLGVEEAVRVITEQRGTKLDPAAVDACIAVIKRGEFKPNVP